MPKPDEPELDSAALAVTEAASSSSEETVEAIQEAMARNDDPTVERKLREAEAKADLTSTRLGWLRSRIRRFFGREES